MKTLLTGLLACLVTLVSLVPVHADNARYYRYSGRRSYYPRTWAGYTYPGYGTYSGSINPGGRIPTGPFGVPDPYGVNHLPYSGAPMTQFYNGHAIPFFGPYMPQGHY